MIITGSIAGLLLPHTSIFIQPRGVKDLIENANDSCARLCLSVRVTGCGCLAVFDMVARMFVGVINP